MYKIYLLPIYTKTLEENKKERDKAIEEAKNYCHSFNYLNYTLELIHNKYRFSFNQVIGFIYVYIDNLLNLKIKRIEHSGKVVLNGKYNFKKEVLWYKENILNFDINNLQKCIKEKIKANCKEKKFYIDDSFVEMTDISNDFIIKLSQISTSARSVNDKDQLVKLYSLKKVSLNELIDEHPYNNYLNTQISSHSMNIFPFISYTSNINSDIIKLVCEDLVKYDTYFVDVDEDTKDILLFEFKDKVKYYCENMAINYDKIKELPYICQTKYIYCHFYNYLLKLKILDENI